MSSTFKEMAEDRWCPKGIDPNASIGDALLRPRREMCTNFLFFMILAVVIFATYSNVYTAPFLYDDNILIVHNQFLRSWSRLPALFFTPIGAGGGNFESSYYRPMQMLLYMVVFQTAGLSLFAFHFLCVAVHVLNAGLVYTLGRKLNFKPGVAFLATLLWALHPLQTDAVTYISAMADTLNSFFCLCGILVLLPAFTLRRILLALPLMMLGLLSKEAAICFPLLAMTCFYLLHDKRFEPRAYLRFFPFFILAGAYAVLHLLLLRHGATLPQANAAAAKGGAFDAFATLPVYARLLLWPTHLHMGHDFPNYQDVWHADVLAGFALVIVAEAQVFFHPAGRSLPLNWGLCWFAASLAPAFTIADVYYEHWIYLSSAALFLGAAQVIALSIERLQQAKIRWVRSSVITFVLLVAGSSSLLSYRHNLTWRDPITFYNNIFAQGEKAATPHLNLGAFYQERGENENAMAQFRTTIVNSGDTLALAQFDLAMTQLSLPDGKVRREEVLTHLHRALEIDPDYYPTLDALAALYEQQDDPTNAALYRAKADAMRKKFSILPDAPM